jgi:polyhydroxyalkanoate synthesis regulator phasin
MARRASSTLSTPVKGPEPDAGGGASDALRSAIEKTFAATADSAVETRDRAGELLDDVARRGQEARDEVTRRGQEARDEVARRSHGARDEVARRGQGVTHRLSLALQRLRGGDDTEAMQRQIDYLRGRVAELEQELKSKSKLKG